MTPARNEKGMVLLLVLVIVALLASLLTEFAFSTLVDLRLTETFRDSTQAWYLAKGGVDAGRMILKMDQHPNYDHPSELWGQGVPAFPVGENGFVSISIEDMQSRLDVNSLVTQGVNANPVLRDALVRLFVGLDLNTSPDDLVAALIDWIDTDDDLTRPGAASGTFNGNGAESEYYQRLDHPYPVKNGPLDSLDELLMVRGFTPEVYSRAAKYLTVQGNAKVNINTASPEVLLSLDPQADPADIEKLVSYRQDQPFENVNDLGKLLGVQNPTYMALKAMQLVQVTEKSDTFRITATGQIGEGGMIEGAGGGQRTVTAFVNHSGSQIYSMRVD